MKFLRIRKLVAVKSWRSAILLILASLLTSSLPALAHGDAGSVGHFHTVAGFSAGFWHPLTGFDHLLAMFAVGIWASQAKTRARWCLPLMFPLVMAAGEFLGSRGVGIPAVEAGIAVSVLVLGLLITCAISLPVIASSALVAVFALMHGVAHGTQLPAQVSGLWYGAGFVMTTALLHIAGLGAGELVNQTKMRGFVTAAGTGLAASGMFFLFSLT